MKPCDICNSHKGDDRDPSSRIRRRAHWYIGNNVLGAISQKTAFFNRRGGAIHVLHGWETDLQHQSLPIETPTNYQYLSYTRRLSRYHAAPVNVDGDNENKLATHKTFKKRRDILS
jgi:hypothetical protein